MASYPGAEVEMDSTSSRNLNQSESSESPEESSGGIPTSDLGTNMTTNASTTSDAQVP